MTRYSKIVDFIRETFQEPTGFIPLHDPRFIGNERKYLTDVMDSNFVSSVGEYVAKFEQLCAQYTGVKYAVAAVNGTAALHIALIVAGAKANEEVITQSVTFIATANAISYTGSHPVFIDVDKDTMGMSPEKLSNFLNKNCEIKADGFTYNKNTGRKIAACLPMHTFGHPVRIDEIVEICNKFNVPCIEDAAESLGSIYKNRHTGSFGLLGTLSFNGNKIITTGGGGMILTNNEQLAKQAKHLTTQAKKPHKWEFVHDQIGYNYRLTNIAAALGCAQIEQLSLFVEKKRELALKYQNFFKNTDFNFFTELKDAKSNYWLNALILKDINERDEFLNYTNQNDIMTRPLWELMNRLPMFKNCEKGNLENSEWLADRVVNLPSSVIIPGYKNNHTNPLTK
ncbi:MAG TPA: LegC family aminotransferase [Salinivirgaceae bacterium]|nr:LegC family aminotransferase [Salinivirgaceae bacterium]